MKNNKDKFDIDFFEFCFLVEACIPPRPIARSMFWNKVIDKYHDLMTKDERKRLYDWIIKCDGFNKNNDDCCLFEARFNPNNQYRVTVNYNGIEEKIMAFKFKGLFYISKNTNINQEFIVDYNLV